MCIIGKAKGKTKPVWFTNYWRLQESFNYYSIFEVGHQNLTEEVFFDTTGSKLNYLEYQLHHIVAREFQRLNKVFPPIAV